MFSAAATLAFAQDETTQTLFTNVHVFDGVNEKRIENANVLVENNLVARVSTDLVDADGATVIDGGGRTLMPGLQDTHVHLAFTTISQSEMFTGLASYASNRSTVDARDMLMRGVTSVRDMGGQHHWSQQSH